MGLLTKLFPPKLVTLAAPENVDTPDTEYAALANKAQFSGFATVLRNLDAESKRGAFRSFLSENGISVYTPSSVGRYMDSITPGDYKWFWKALGPVTAMSLERKDTWNIQYTKPVPAPVLMTVVKIREAFPSAEFSVTDIDLIPKGDPFLRVIHEEASYIIERWDEPAFRS